MTTTKIDLVDPLRFVQATRDSGYRNIASALSELVDNSLQAGARRVDIVVHDSRDNETEPFVAVLDDGCGMRPQLLCRALQFGGSNRFDDRSGMGRFGMGLPNSSLSQARRVDIYTWRRPTSIWHTYLDLDELLATAHPHLPLPKHKALPLRFRQQTSSSGTLVVWRDLDRGRPGSWKTLVARLERRLGQIFRHFLWDSRVITVNGKIILPSDPLFLSGETRTSWVQACQYGQTLEYPVDLGDGRRSVVEVRFSELPVCEFGPLSNQEKRLAGIVNGAGVSIVRAGREIDYGWFLMDKRRENYDDWWRCEIRFGPELDEMFGVTHIKQGIRPTETLRSIMTGELGSIARTLNRRVRLAHIDLAAQQVERAAANVAAQKDILLRALPVAPGLNGRPITTDGQRQYRLALEKIDERVFSQTRFQEGQITVILNTMHEFFRDVYGPLVDADSVQSQHHRKQLELLLFALGRTLHLERPTPDQAVIQSFMTDWSRAIAAFCGGSAR
jgi:hypothetical protein